MKSIRAIPSIVPQLAWDLALAVAAILLLAIATASFSTVWAAPLTVKIGVITDMAGPLAGQSGPGSLAAAEMAREDCLAGPCKGMDIQIISADHKNDAGLASQIVREWIDVQHVDAVTDIIQAAVQIAIQHLIEQKDRIALFSGGTARLVNEDCAPNTSVMWMWDTYGQAAGLARPHTKPGTKWFFIVADYAFGHGLQADATPIIEQLGGKVVGGVAHPFGFAGDFSPFLLQAQASGADRIAIGSTGADLVNILKAAHEFSIPQPPQQLDSFVLQTSDVTALGLDVAKGIEVQENFYWNMDPRARAWSERFIARRKTIPTTVQAGVYSNTLGYLKAVAAAGTTDRAAVMTKLHQLPIDDAVIRHATLRPDGRVQHDGYLWRVKTPAESKEPFDDYELVATIPPDQAFRPLSQSLCPKEKWFKD
jgi:branched-chain amino acid transport system substrate-binding protein